MYQQPYGYSQGAPGLAPGLAAPAGANTPLIPPNFNFNAPVIHFGQTLSGATTISTPQPSTVPAMPVPRPVVFREAEGPRLAPSAEDQLHTVFIGAIPEDLSDEWMERITRSLGKLKEWRRATDGADKPRLFGFAIYEDAESTNRAFHILEELEIPNLQPGRNASKLNARIDESTIDYLATLGAGQSSTEQERDLDARAYLTRVVEELKDPVKRQMKSESKAETKQEDGQLDIDEADYVPASVNGGMKILVSGADEDTSTIPTAQREIILKEIAAFRERSNRRERNKTWFEEEEKSRHDRDQSPSRTDSRRPNRSQDISDDRKGPKSIEPQENIPLGPAADRRRAPREYHQSMRFRTSSDRYDRDDDEDIPDDELERRRQDKKKRELEAKFVERERKWLSRENMRTSALEREMTRNQTENRTVSDKESMLARLSKWDDDVEAEKQFEEYYKDRQLWARKRVEYRRKETEKDERDRQIEAREANNDRSRAAALADSFLEQQAFEIGAKVNADAISGIHQPLRLRMTRENIKAAPASPAKRSMEEAEGLLEEDEEEENYQSSSRKKRLLIPLEYDKEDSRDRPASEQDQLRALVSSIPSDTKNLWEYPIHWDCLDNSILEVKIRPFATKKIIEAFGIQEQDLIDFVVEHISNHGSAETLAKELEMTLDEEAEIFVKKMWRMLILETESKRLKIST